jgi:hypothetical protein
VKSECTCSCSLKPCILVLYIVPLSYILIGLGQHTRETSTGDRDVPRNQSVNRQTKHLTEINSAVLLATNIIEKMIKIAVLTAIEAPLYEEKSRKE